MSIGSSVEGQCFNCKAHALSVTLVQDSRRDGNYISTTYCRRCKRIQPDPGLLLSAADIVEATE